MVRLSDLVGRLGGACEGAADPLVLDVDLDSRRVRAGTLFAALPGGARDGGEFVPQALERGAVAVLSARRLATPDERPNWVHPEARRVAGEAAAVVHGHPSRGQGVVGITGTNGKSTVLHMTAQLLRHCGRRPGVSGTVGIELWGDGPREATHTTPDATELQRLCRRNLELGGDAFVLEVSSHALDQERIAGLELDVAVYTNLSRDHLDYHPTMDAYAAAKERIFAHLAPGGSAVVNLDDGHAERMIRAARASGARVVTYGIGSRADLRADRLEIGEQGIHLFLEGMGIPRTGFFLPLLGRHDVENALAALAAVLRLGASPSHAVRGLAAISTPRGRLEEVATGGRGFRVFVDYAHTPDALERVLDALRRLPAPPGGARRVLCVFGCGGGRDAEKRAPMGAAVARAADVAIVTDDNPRDEEPAAIAAEILRGMASGSAEVVVEPDRRNAIREALRRARPGDLVLIAGKGHERWQWSRGRKLPFDDVAVAREELP